MTDLEKAIGLPSDMDPEHKYVYSTGFHGIKDYWYVDKAGNYWRYTNAPEDNEEYNEYLGEPLVPKGAPAQSPFGLFVHFL